MPANPSLYPLDFPSDLSQSGDDDSLELENAINLLRLQNRNTAVRQALNRRISGQNDVSNQNKTCRAFARLMPLTQIGAKQVPVPIFLGTIAHLSGGRTHAGETVRSIASFSYPNETASPTGFYLSAPRSYMGTVGNQTSGLFCGGSDAKGLSAVVDEIFYRQPSVRRIGAQLTIPLFGAAGMGDKVIGVLLGGSDASGMATKRGEIITYGNEPTVESLGNALATARIAPHNGTSNPATGFVYGGCGAGFNAESLLLSIEAFNFATRTVSPVGASLTRTHVVHAAVGSAIKGYLLGGGQPPLSSWFGDSVTAFTYSGQTVALLGATLPEPAVCQDGVGSSVAGYAVGGDTTTSSWNGTKTILKLNYGTESLSKLGSELPDTAADQGGVSDYGAGFS